MERTQLFDLMGELKLFGMKAAFDEVMATALKRQHEPQRVVGDLLKAEISEKQTRSIKYQLTIAKLPLANGTAIPAGVCLMNGPGKVVRQVWRSFVISPEWPTGALLRNVWIRGAKRDPRRYRLVRQAAALLADPIRYERRGAST